MLIYLTLMAEAFFGYLLPWGQMSYWGAQVIVNLFSTIPLIGEDLALWIRGDYTISDITLNRFFAFHVIAIPLVLLLLVAAHLMALHETGSNNPDGVEIKQQPKDPRTGLPLDGIYSHPYYTIKDIVGVIFFLIVFSIIVFFVPEMGGYFIEHNNFIPADPLKTPEHIAPVWYFTPYYAMLRAVPSFLGTQFWGVLVMGVAVLIFFALPWLDRSPVKSIRYRGWRYKVWLAAFVVSFLILGYLGVVPVTVWGQFPAGIPVLGDRRCRDRGRAGLHGRLFPVLPADALVHGPRQDEAGSGKGHLVKAKLAILAAVGAALLTGSTLAPALAAGRRGAHGTPRHRSARPRVAAARREAVRELLPQLPQREVHALQRADQPRTDRAADHART